MVPAAAAAVAQISPSDREDENPPWPSTIVEQRSIILFPNFAREVINLGKFVFDVEAVCICNE